PPVRRRAAVGSRMARIANACATLLRARTTTGCVSVNMASDMRAFQAGPAQTSPHHGLHTRPPILVGGALGPTDLCGSAAGLLCFRLGCGIAPSCPIIHHLIRTPGASAEGVSGGCWPFSA